MLAENITATRNVDNRLSHGTVFATLNRIRTLTRRDHLTFMDWTHKTKSFGLETVLISGPRRARSVGFMYANAERKWGWWYCGAFLILIKKWCGGRCGWRRRYFITDDSAAEQLAVSLAFQGLIQGELKTRLFSTQDSLRTDVESEIRRWQLYSSWKTSLWWMRFIFDKLLWAANSLSKLH